MNAQDLLDAMERELEQLQWIFSCHYASSRCRDLLADSIHSLRQAISSQRAGAKQEDERQLDLPL